MKKLLCVISAFAVLHGAQAQLTTFQTNGAPDKRHTVFAFTNAHIQADAETVIGNGTMLVQDGMITDIGTTVNIPKGAVVYDMQGKWIYPSFIDPYTTYGMPEPKRSPWTPGPQYFSARDGAYGWNDALKPETDASAVFSSDKKAAEEMRGLGFGTVMVYSNDGIARGTASCVTLNAEDGDNSVFVKQKVANCLSFDKGTSRQEYPSSLMGAIALLRQTYYDADWYRTAKNRKEFNLSLEAWNNVQSLPQIFETTDKWNVLRADKVGDEFNIQYIFKGSGNEYQRMNEMKNTNASFILPLNFPKAFDVSDPYDAEQIAYTDLKHWEMAPLNPGAFEKYGINFALTTSDLEDKKDFWENLRKAIKFGLSEKAALKALTTVPAQLLGIANKTGALKKDLLANFIITNGNVFTDDAVIWENWVKGKQYILRDANTVDVRGTYSMTVGGNPMTLDVEGDIFKPRGSFKKIDSIKGPVNVSCDGNRVDISWTYKKSGTTVLLTGLIDPKTKAMSGSGQEPDGTWIKWSATQTAPFTPKPEPKDTTAPDIPSLDDVIYPFAPFGRTIKDSLEIDRFQMSYSGILIKNVTVWTNEADSMLYNTDVLLQDGKITAIGKNIAEPAAKGLLRVMVIDGTGKHLTPGIVDEHSHIAISGGVNEGTEASSAEVRIGDVINPEDVSIYRDLAGGVVAAQLLHGSANPIGGQSGIVKMRWGATGEQMKISYAVGFIKFALGENVKQSNWGDNYNIRFPQTRMGVEQVYYDYFQRAKEYNAEWAAWNALSPKEKAKGTPPRRDLDLEAVGEILKGTRNITCHSYVQSELEMLMSVADSMHFKVNTFTHILEGYKIADKMKAHGVGGSTFSDWWAYKYEVKDAIPYNAAIMTRMGIIVAVNSDDAEMSRRLNQEAAKSIKYGGLTEVQAMKLVTINPATLLHLDQHMGSIKVGKDADVVLWSDNPTSVYARVEKTIVDGKLLYDAQDDIKLRDEMHRDRARIIQEMIAEKNGGAPVRLPKVHHLHLWTCDDLITDGSYLSEQ